MDLFSISFLRGKKLFFKTISILMIQAFLVYSVGHTVPLSTHHVIIEPDSSIGLIRLSEISIPKYMGMIREIYGGSGEQLVIHIQDAHCNYEAQYNIAAILEVLVNEKGIELIGVEGADSVIDTSFFGALPNLSKQEELAAYFLENGDITGTEYLSITSGRDFTIYGVEDREYYIRNLNAFLNGYVYRDEFKKYYSSIKEDLRALKGKIYGEELFEFDTNIEAYISGEKDFADHVKYLNHVMQQKVLGTEDLRNFDLVLRIIEVEETIDFDVVDRERTAMIEDLTEKMTEKDINELVGKSFDFRMGKISDREFYSFLSEAARVNGIDAEGKYGNLYRYMFYVDMYGSVENEDLFKEIDRIIENIKEKMFANEDERTLDSIWRKVRIASRFVDLEVTNDDYDYYRSNRDVLGEADIERFILMNSSRFGIVPNAGTRPEKLRTVIDSFIDFYEIAQKRDEILVDNLLRGMNGKGTKSGVLVAGGFHTRGITDVLKERGVSYLVVSPSITQDAPNRYMEILTGHLKGVKNLSAERYLQIISKFCSMCRDPRLATTNFPAESDRFYDDFAAALVSAYSEIFPDISFDSREARARFLDNVIQQFRANSRNADAQAKRWIEARLQRMKDEAEAFTKARFASFSPRTKKAPNTEPLSDEEILQMEDLIRSREQAGEYEDVSLPAEVVTMIKDRAPPAYRGMLDDINKGRVIVRALEMGMNVGFPRENPLNREFYYYSKIEGDTLIIYTTKVNAFLMDPYYKVELAKTEEGRQVLEQANSRFAQGIAHEYGENRLGKTHAEVSSDEMFFASSFAREAGISDINLFILDRAAEDGDITYLVNILKEHDPHKDPTGNFRKAVISAIGKTLALYFIKQDVEAVHDDPSSLSGIKGMAELDTSVIDVTVMERPEIGEALKEAAVQAEQMIERSIQRALVKRAIDKKQDLRGEATECFTAEVSYRIGKAYGTILRSENPFGKNLSEERLVVPIGRDARVTGPRIREALIRGLNEVGVDAVDIAPGDMVTTTPMVGFAMASSSGLKEMIGRENIDGGIQLTASHLEAPYNGVKMYIGEDNISSNLLREVLRRAQEEDYQVIGETEGQGTSLVYKDLGEDYINHIENYMRGRLGERGLAMIKGKKVVVDPGNGTGGIFIDVLKRLGADVVGIYADPNGYFPNHISDPNSKEFDSTGDLIRMVRETGADIGISFDSDADRVGFVTGSGHKVTGHELLMYLADRGLDDYPGGTVIFNNRTTQAIDEIVWYKGGKTLRAPTGYTRIIEAIRERQAAGEMVVLGGEESAHIMFPENDFRDDGVFSAATLICMLSREEQSFDEILSGYPHYTLEKTIRLTISSDDPMECEQAKRRIEQHVVNRFKMMGIENIITDDGVWVYMEDMQGWTLIRGSLSEAKVFGVDIESKVPENTPRIARRVLDILMPLHEDGTIDITPLRNFIIMKAAAIGEAPNLRPADKTPWGAIGTIQRFKGIPVDEETYGESWECSGQEELPGHVLALEGVELTLRELISSDPKNTIGKELKAKYGPNNPLLLKYLAAEATPYGDDSGNLSVQVHPQGKTESWIVLGATPTMDPNGREIPAYIYMGFKKDLTGQRERDEFIRDLKDPNVNVAEKYLNKIPVKPGDVFYIPAGTVHAIGKGCFLAEVQETSDLTTYRLWDWNRVGPDGQPRELHIDQAIEVLNFARTGEGDYRQVPKRIRDDNKGNAVFRLIAGELFSVEQMSIIEKGSVPEDTAGRFHILSCLKGSIVIRAPGRRDISLSKGHSAFIPANTGKYQVIASKDAEVLKAYIPEVVDQRREFDGEDLVGIVEELAEKRVIPRLSGRDLREFRTNHTLGNFIKDHSPVKNIGDIAGILRRALNNENDPLYQSLFGDKRGRRRINIAMLRGGRGGSQFTQDLVSIPGVNVTTIVAGTDDGRSWFDASQEFDATGIPDTRKCISDYLAVTKPELKLLNEGRFVSEVKELVDGQVQKRHIASKNELVEELGKLIAKMKNPSARVVFRKEAGADKLFQQVLKVNEKHPGVVTEMVPYLEKVHRILFDRRNDPEYKFTLGNVPLGSLLLLGVKLDLEAKLGTRVEPQESIDVISKIYGVPPVKFKVVNASRQQAHLMGMLQDGTIFLTETGINEYPRTSSFYGLWYVDSDTVKELLGQTEIAGVPVHRFEEYNPRHPDTGDKEIYETVRKISNATPSNIRKVASLIEQRSREMNVESNPAAIEALKNADIIVLVPTTNFSNMNPSLTLGPVSEAFKSSSAFKIWFTNMAKDTCDERGPFFASSILEGIVRSGEGTLSKYGHDEWWEAAPGYVSYVVGNSEEYQGLATDMPRTEDNREYAILDGYRINQSSGGAVIPVGMLLENPEGTHTKRKDYSDAVLYGMYKADWMVEAMLALYDMQKAGYGVDKDGNLIEIESPGAPGVVAPAGTDPGIGPVLPFAGVSAGFEPDQQAIAATTNNSTSIAQVTESISTVLINDNMPVSAANMLFSDSCPSNYRVEVLIRLGNKLLGEYAKDKSKGSILRQFFKAVIEYASKMEPEYSLQSREITLIAAQGMNIISWIERGIPRAEGMTLTSIPENMLKSPDKERGASYLTVGFPVTQSTGEGKPGMYWRGVENISKLQGNILQEAIYHQEGFDEARENVQMYVMNHGWMEVPQALEAMTESGDVTTVHETAFITDFLPGSMQYASTGPGHFQRTLDLKYVTEGEGIQYNKFYDTSGKLVSVFAQHLKPGSYAFAFPGAVDSMENLGGLRFNDISVRIDDSRIDAALRTIDPSFRIQDLLKAESIISKASGKAPYVAVNKDGKPTLVRNEPGAPDVVWIEGISPSLFGNETLTEFYSGVDETGLISKAEGLAEVVFSSDKVIRKHPISVIEKIEPSYRKALTALDRMVRKGRPIPFRPSFKLGVDGYTWGEPVDGSTIPAMMNRTTTEQKVALIVENLDEAQMESYRARYDAETEPAVDFDVWLLSAVENDVIAERWITAGLIDLGIDGTLPVDVLALWSEKVFGVEHVSEFGAESRITAKHLTSARPLSMQIHEFDEMIIPLEDGYAYLGLSRDVSQEELIDALLSGDISVFNRVPVKKGEPIVVRAGMPHAYGEVKVFEVKAVNAAQDKAGTISFYDRLRWELLSPGERAEADAMLKKVMDSRDAGDVKAAEETVREMVEAGFVRDKKDVITLSRDRVLEIVSKIEGYGYLRAADLDQARFMPLRVRGDEKRDGAFTDIMGVTEGLVSVRHTMGWQKTLQADPLMVGREHSIFVTEGLVHVLDDKGARVATLEKGKEIKLPKNLGRYSLKSVDRHSVVYSQYRPLESERSIVSVYQAVKESADQLRGRKIDYIYPREAFRGDEIRVIRSFLSSRLGVDARIIPFSAAVGLSSVKESSLREDAVQVLLATQDNLINADLNDAVQRRILEKSVKLPTVLNIENLVQRESFYNIEIMAAGAVLAVTDITEQGVEGVTMNRLQRLFSQLTGRRLAASDIYTLLRFDYVSEFLPEERRSLDAVVRFLQGLLMNMPAVPKDVRQELERRRQVLWSV